jgi:hypothetical protein
MDDHKKIEQPDRTIAFPPGENGRLELGGGGTILSGLLALGALAKTRHYDKEAGYTFQTDRDGLDTVVALADDVTNGANSLIGAIGHLIVHADHKEIPSGTWRDIGWGLAALSELAKDASFLGAEAAHQTSVQHGAPHPEPIA